MMTMMMMMMDRYFLQKKTCSISETGQDMTNVIIDD